MDLPQIKIGNDLLGNALVSSIQVFQELNRHWTCTVVCRQGVGERISIEQMLGQPVTISGLGEDQVERLMLTGFVLSTDLVYESGGAFSAQIVAVSNTYKMDVAPRKQYYDDKSLAEIVSTLAPTAGLKGTVSAPEQKKLNYVQYAETDFSFLNRIVDDYGAWIRPNEAGFEVFAAFQSGTTVQWRDKADLIDFKLSGTLSPASFSGVHYNHHTMQSETYTGVTKKPQFYDKGPAFLAASVAYKSASVLPPGFVFDRSRAMENETFRQALEDEAERSIGGSIFGMGHTRNPALKAGDELTIEGPMDSVGVYGLIKVVHMWSVSGYQNSFVCTPWKNYRNPRAPEVRTWPGLVPARVVAHDDPKKMGRVKVRFFWQEQNSTHWARTTSPHAGPNRGFMFMPEVGDEVAIAFEDGDPERPVIIGSLWNGVQTQYRGDFRGGDVATNDVKHLMTKSGNRLQLSDKEGVETVVLATPHNNRLKMTERSDQTGRVNITLESLTGDIILHAPKGRVHIESLFYSKDIGGE